jgi:hypothetical protein
MRLFEPSRHESITEVRWDDAVARAAIARIAGDAEAAFRAEAYWPIHPFDVSDERPDGLKPLYFGATGVIWALTHLAEAGAIAPTRDYLPALRALPAAHAADIANISTVAAYAGRDTASFLLGELGMHVLEHRFAPSAALEASIEATLMRKRGDARGLAWGSAGSMLAALFMHERTGDARWREAFLAHFDAVWEELAQVEDAACALWTTELYGGVATRTGTLHGFFGNAYAALRGIDLLPDPKRVDALATIHTAFERAALQDGEYANWPSTTAGLAPESQAPHYVQFCMGAPGVVACMSAFPDEAANDLLFAGGELIWRAGPVTKMPSLCHGVAGSGFAFLKLFERTGDALWLERARAFGMHGIAQSERALAHYGQRKFSLWTGDLGLAAFLWSCVSADAAVPALDRL